MYRIVILTKSAIAKTSFEICTYDLKYASGRTLSAHSLRHTAGTLGIKGEGDLRQVQDLLGHSDLKTTAIYLHVRERYTHNPALNIDVEI